MKMSDWMKRSVAVLGLGLLVVSCAPSPPDPTVAELTVVAAANANPNPAGQGSPTVVLVYALQPGAPFRIADYDALTGGEMGALAETMQRIGRFIVSPGDQTEKVFELPPGTAGIGVAAGYREVATASWRAEHAVTPHEVTSLTARIGANAVTLE